jgi:hypothetical protein
MGSKITMNNKQNDDLNPLREYLHSRKFIPRFLRDFHDAKDVFKIIGEYDAGYIGKVHWTLGQCYVIDHFLHKMAAFGYTLQKSRKPIVFCSLEKSIEEYKQREVDMLNAFMAEKKEQK